jgi:ATP-dependent protease ClpP protease subunit
MHKKTLHNNKGLLEHLIKGSQSESFNTDYGSIKDYYISDEIGSPEEYSQMIHEIRSSRQTDVIKLHINCPGGSLFTTIQLLQAMAECEAHIIASVEGACMSAATLIFLCADEFMITNHSMFLFHNYSGGTFGKGGEMYHGVIHERKWSEGLMRDLYSDFLTDEEITELINDKDIWMDAEHVLERLEKRGKLIEKKTKAVQKENTKVKKPKNKTLLNEES